MSRCTSLISVGRRQFLRGSIVAGAAGVTLTGAAGVQEANADQSLAGLIYPSTRLANVAELSLNVPFDIFYPDEDVPGVLLKLGTKVTGGVGPDQDIVGFTTLCPHRGFPLGYSADRKTFNCPAHYSVFDAELGGQQVWGHATQNLPQYTLHVDSSGDISASGVDELIYGRLSNIL